MFKPVVIIVLGVCVLVSVVSAQTRDESWKVCTSANLDERIVGCTALVRAGHETRR
jgi:hypothetical protein